MVSAASTTLLAVVALVASSPVVVNAFTSARSHRIDSSAAGGPLYAATDDASAQALSDYMAKSHEEKLRAVKDVEDKKNSEIAALKAEIQQLKASSALATAAPATALPVASPLAASTADLESKLASYQSFMTEYIVNAQNQKLLAVKEAELKAEKKFQERLEKLFEAGSIGHPADAAPAAAAAVVEETLFQKRNAGIIAAAAAGKSRWGDMEVERAIVEQMKQPAIAVSTTSEAPLSAFELRNAQVVAAAGAGKSRWGDMEVERAKNGAVASAAVVEEENLAAPVSLEDRVNLGARLLAA